GVLVRYWSKPKLDQWLRISIGTNEEMQKLMNCFDA
ncbi:MAG: histidinol-phosphate/aromatic aminotransferase/cobyric acid decarboxylase-like protein, partial [Gammaproteobacteria bacterium]